MTVSNYQLVTQQLNRLGWSWSSRRIIDYITELNSVYGIVFTPEALPNKHYLRLMKYFSVTKGLINS